MNAQDDDKIKKQVVALRYNQDQAKAPLVIAKGKGYVAEKILETAKANAVPVYQNKTLVSMLMAVELDQEIPPAMYQAVSEVLSYVYRLDQKMGKRRR